MINMDGLVCGEGPIWIYCDYCKHWHGYTYESIAEALPKIFT